MRFRKSPYFRKYEFLSCMGDFAYTARHTTPGMTHSFRKCISKYLCNPKGTRRKSIGFFKAYLHTSRKLGLGISFHTHFWSQWVIQNYPDILANEQYSVNLVKMCIHLLITAVCTFSNLELKHHMDHGHPGGHYISKCLLKLQ